MFPYSDPGKTLKPAKALANYRMLLHIQYRQSAKLPRSVFTLLETFQEVNLVAPAAVPNLTVAPGAVCRTLGSGCGPNRNSDPSIAAAAQTLARGGRGLSLADPVGIEIARLGDIWRLNGQELAINDPTRNQGVWTVTRGGATRRSRRAPRWRRRCA